MPKTKKRRRNTEEQTACKNIRKNSFEILFAQIKSTETSEKSNSIQKDIMRNRDEKYKEQWRNNRKRNLQVYCMGHLIDYNSNC